MQKKKNKIILLIYNTNIMYKENTYIYIYIQKIMFGKAY